MSPETRRSDTKCDLTGTGTGTGTGAGTGAGAGAGAGAGTGAGAGATGPRLSHGRGAVLPLAAMYSALLLLRCRDEA
ncbi:hypothetical protein EDF24_3135 [Curtobacterium sp. PhB130]|nr:hypothetical protein EDF24_3135 [Curtobacterium sp. PhB130]